jgi:hypothetical protein
MPSTSAASRTNVSPQGRTLSSNFDPNSTYLVAGSEQRLVFGVVETDRSPATDGPAVIEFQVTRDGQSVGAPTAVPRHRDGVPIVYYPLRFTPPEAGVYTVTGLLDGAPIESFIQPGSPNANALVQRGQPMRPVATATVTDPVGIDPICTRRPEPCPLHDVTVSDVLAAGQPLALLISTPQFCKTGICGPVLDLVLEQRDTYPTVRFVHAEPYADAVAKGNVATATLAPVVETYALTFEPSLLLARADGVLVERLDNVFDRVELRAGLERIAV